MRMIFVLFVFLTAAASETMPPRHCRIAITYALRSGKTNTETSWTTATTRDACRREAKLHETNYSPRTVISKKVRWSWDY